MMKIIKTPQGHACLNLGCGSAYRATWTNVDMKAKGDVQACDLRYPLPVASGTFDAVYSSHVLEHLTEEDGLRLAREMFRILKPGGVCRIVVPDLEGICRLYLEKLTQADAEPTSTHLQNYRWMRLELMDQMVRRQSGGKMRETLEAGDFDLPFLKERMADQFEHYWSKNVKPKKSRLWKKVRAWLFPLPTPQQSGEAHLWMYDRLSLRLLVEKAGFTEPRRCSWHESRIPNWTQENLDVSRQGDGPRKPDSIYFEAVKPSAGPS